MKIDERTLETTYSYNYLALRKAMHDPDLFAPAVLEPMVHEENFRIRCQGVIIGYIHVRAGFCDMFIPKDVNIIKDAEAQTLYMKYDLERTKRTHNRIYINDDNKIEEIAGVINQLLKKKGFNIIVSPKCGQAGVPTTNGS